MHNNSKYRVVKWFDKSAYIDQIIIIVLLVSSNGAL